MKYLVPLLFMLLFIAIVVSSVIYLSKRMHFYFGTETIRYWYLFFACMPVFMITGMAVFSNSTSLAGSMIYRIAAVITGFTLYFLFTVLLIDLVNLLFKLEGRILQGQILGLASFIITGIIVLLGVLNAFIIRTSRHEVRIPGLSNELTVVHLSDVHIGHFRGAKFLEKILDLSVAENPDAIFITGDLFDGRINLSEKKLEPMKDLGIPVYFIEGNHDGYTGVAEIKDLLRKQGVHVLENELALLNDLQVVGLKHMKADSNTRSMHTTGGASIKGTLDSMIIDRSRPAILLHHSPEGAEYAARKGIDLYLSGHTHGGQIFPVTLLNEILFPYNRGMNTYEEMKVFVSEGVGTFGPPMRIGTISEVVVLKLKPS